MGAQTGLLVDSDTSIFSNIGGIFRYWYHDQNDKYTTVYTWYITKSNTHQTFTQKTGVDIYVKPKVKPEVSNR